jgi:hypothetical protein
MMPPASIPDFHVLVVHFKGAKHCLGDKRAARNRSECRLQNTSLLRVNEPVEAVTMCCRRGR